jgi:hypothetical protein
LKGGGMSQNLLYYTVSIAGVTAAAPGDGFIDNLPATSYIVPGSGGTYDMSTGWPTNAANATARARANIRWNSVLSQLASTVTPFAVQNVSATGATNSAQADTMDFTVVYDRPDYLYAYDELNPGEKLYNDDAIKRWIARALVANVTVDNYPVIDPTAFSNPNFHYGESLISVNAAPLAADIAAAEELITVTFVTSTSGQTYYPIT